MRGMRATTAILMAGVLGVLFPHSDAWAEDTDTTGPSPTTTFQATRGLSQTLSAETMGAGRLTFSIAGTWYKQARDFRGVPPEGTGVSTGTGAFSFGVNSYVDVFASVGGYGLYVPSPGTNEFGLGSISAGILGALPLPAVSPLHLGAQVSIIGGTAGSQINTNTIDGYNYFETREGYDFMGRAMETLVFGDDSRGIKIHLNQGAVMSLQEDHGNIFMLGAGIQGIAHPVFAVGVEVNSRTFLSSFNMLEDPLWLTPTVLVRTPFYFNVGLGIDISLSSERDAGALRALEPYRIFGDLVFSFDLLAAKRRAALEKERRQAEEKAAMEKKANDAQAKADSIAQKARTDSLALSKAGDAERQRADSLARKAREDSLAQAETNLKLQKQLQEERDKRSDMEKQLLSTGLLLLDAVYFETGKAEISINSRPYLTIIGKMLLKYPKLQIEIGGHTDNTGRMETNVALSQARSDAVRGYLIMVAPDLSGRITARGYGPSMPKADNRTADGRKINRRVELQVMNKDALKEYNP